ncbi:peptide chain release factor 1 [Candidatus Dependentiae bacterium]|nr:peptide chain release factor 1 [Candidatus Dependentiae bacterium]
MNDTLIQWDVIQERYDELSNQLATTSLDVSKRHSVQKELSYVSTLLGKHKEIVRLTTAYEALQVNAQDNSDPEMASLYREEMETIYQALLKEQHALDRIMFPPDPLDNRSAFVEIRAGAGGQEASLFAADLLRMYSNYALKQHWKTAIMSTSLTDLGGYREVVLHIQGKDVYGHLKFESGVHRVQRVPLTETSGRIHTSTATVAVLPELEEVELSINPSDLRIDVYRASGAGGQHVNTTDSAVRITHIPTGLVVTCQDERSQYKNKMKALKVLQSRLFAQQKESQQQEMSQKRKELVGGGMRAEKVRTYNFAQNRVTDHQANVTLNKLDMVLEGNLGDIVNALIEKERIERKKQPLAYQ